MKVCGNVSVHGQPAFPLSLGIKNGAGKTSTKGSRLLEWGRSDLCSHGEPSVLGIWRGSTEKADLREGCLCFHVTRCPASAPPLWPLWKNGRNFPWGRWWGLQSCGGAKPALRRVPSRLVKEELTGSHLWVLSLKQYKTSGSQPVRGASARTLTSTLQGV